MQSANQLPDPASLAAGQSGAPAAPIRPRSRRRWLLGLTLLLLAAAGAAAYYFRRPGPEVAIPEVSTNGLEPVIASAVLKARSEIVAQPTSAAKWGTLGMIFFAHTLYAECVDFLARAEQLDPSDVRWPYLLGLALVLSRPDEGIVALRRAAEIPPPIFFVRLRLAEETLKARGVDDADPLYKELTAEMPNDPRVLLGRGLILLRRNQTSEAIVLLRQAAEMPTARRSARIALAEAYQRLGESDAAERERKLANEVGADIAWTDPIINQAETFLLGTQARVDYAIDLSKRNQTEEAIALLSQIVRDNPSSDEAHFHLGKLLIRSGEFDQAAQALRQAINVNPNMVEAYYLLAGIQMTQKDYAAAESNYLHVIKLKSTHGLAHHMLGECRIKRGNRTGAKESFRTALRYRPDLALTHLELGQALLEDGETKDALPYLERAVQLEPNNERAAHLLKDARAKTKS